MSQSIGTRGQLAFLSLPAVVFTVAMIAFPFAYTVWFSLHEFSFGGSPRFNWGMNYADMVGDGEFWKSRSFAYYSRWQFYTCSIYLDQRDPKTRWRRTADGATRVQTPQGSFVIHADPESYVFEFQNVQRAKFCGMYGSINGTMTILRNTWPPRCTVGGILER